MVQGSKKTIYKSKTKGTRNFRKSKIYTVRKFECTFLSGSMSELNTCYRDII